MKKMGIILVIIFTILVGLWIWVLSGSNQIFQNEIKPKAFSPQFDDRGQVTVDITPLSLELGKEAKFKVVLDTHSVELSYDLLRVSSLRDDKDSNFKPLSWGGGSGGHHLTGELVFPGLSAKTKSVELIILNISGFDRRFTWNL